MSSFRRRTPLEPPENNDKVVDRVRTMGRDPSPTFSLNARQLELLEARKQREQQQASSSSSKEDEVNRTPLRTPNPISRSAMSGVPSETSAQKAFLRQMLQKATSKQQQQQSTTSSASSSHTADQKALLKKVLHKTMGHKQQQQQSSQKPRSHQSSHFRWKSRAETQERRKAASIFRTEIKPDQVDETIRQTFRRSRTTADPEDRPEERTVKPPVKRDDGLEGYEAFLQTLKTEVSGQHSQLWSSFLALMQGQAPDTTIVVPNTKPYKFDPPTKQKLTAMNIYLRKCGHDCKAETQLINDKKWLKERLARESPNTTITTTRPTTTTTSNSRAVSKERSKEASVASHHREELPQSSSSSSRNLQSKSQNSLDAVNSKDVSTNAIDSIEKFRSAVSMSSSSSSQKKQEKDSSKDDDTSDTVRTHKSSSTTDPIIKVRSKSSSLETTDSMTDIRQKPSSSSSHETTDLIMKMRSSSYASADRILKLATTIEDEDVPDHLEKHRNMLALTDALSMSAEEPTPREDKNPCDRACFNTCGTATNNKPSPTASDHPSVAPSDAETIYTENGSNPGLEVTFSQFKSKFMQPTPTSSVGPAPWLDVKLRKTTDEPPDGSVLESDATPSWVNMTLRRVERKKTSPRRDHLLEARNNEEAILSSQSSSEITGPKFFEPKLPDLEDVRENESQPATSSLPEYKSEPLKQPKTEDRRAERNEEPADTKTTPQHSNNRKEQKDSKKAKFDGHPNFIDKIDEAVVFRLKKRPESPEHEESRVIVGKKMLMLVKSRSGESQATVLWKIPREGVHSMNLDMATLQVDLVLSDGPKKFLSFNTSEDCLKFANAFYNMTEIAAAKENFPVADDESLDSFGRLTNPLSEEEQTVLEKYRELRQTKPPEDALQASLSWEKKTSTSSLSAAEEEVASKYRKMIKLSIPMDAVKHKMKQDDVDEKIVSAVVGEAESKPPDIVATDGMPTSPISTMSASVALSAKELEIAEEYQKMLRLKIPSDAVRHKMVKDDVDPKIVAFVLGDDSSSTTGSSELSQAEEQLAEGYRKMLKISIPPEAVRHKMVKDEVSPKVISAVLGQGSVEDSQSAESKQETGPAESKKKKPDLTEEEQSIASQYRKMLKLQIPREQVLQRMQQEGASEKIIKSVVGNSSLLAKKDKASPEQGRSGNKFVSLHITPLLGKDLDDGSVWRATQNRNAAQLEGSDISQLIDLFQKKSSIARKEKKANAGANGPGKAKLLDLTRSNNVAISLKAFKEFSMRQLADIIAFLDPLRKVRGERVQFLRDLLPTATEVKAVQAYEGSDERLVPAEMWFREIVDVKRIETKVQVLRTMELLKSEAASLAESFSLLSLVCKQIMESEKLKDLLEMVLRIGNVMNEGTRTGGAAGFKFDSLLKLTQTKSSDGKTTVLDFLVTVFVARGKRETLDLSSDFPECQTASRMLISDLVNEVKSMQENLSQCRDELKALEEDAGVRKRGTQKIGSVVGSVTSSSVNGSRVDLMASILARAGGPEKEDGSESQGLVARQRQQFGGKPNDPSSNQSKESFESTRDSSGPSAKNNLHGAIERLQEFLVDGEDVFSMLERERDEALDACRDLARYCAENGGLQATTSLLGILAEFASSLDRALKKFDERQETESRKQKRKREESSGSSVSTFDRALKKFGVKQEEAGGSFLGGPTLAAKESGGKEATETLTTKGDGESGSTASSDDHASKTLDGKHEAQTQKRRRDVGASASMQAKEPTNAELIGQFESKDSSKSLVLMVNEMLQDASQRAREDFKKGRVYHNPSSRLKEIYEKEKKTLGMGSPRVARRKLDIVTAIREREGKIDQDEVQRARSQFARDQSASRTERDTECTGDDSESIQQSLVDYGSADTSKLTASRIGVRDAAKQFELSAVQNESAAFWNNSRSLDTSKEAASSTETDEGYVGKLSDQVEANLPRDQVGSEIAALSTQSSALDVKNVCSENKSIEKQDDVQMKNVKTESIDSPKDSSSSNASTPDSDAGECFANTLMEEQDSTQSEKSVKLESTAPSQYLRTSDAPEELSPSSETGELNNTLKSESIASSKGLRTLDAPMGSVSTSTTEVDDRSTQQETHLPEEIVDSESVEPSEDSSAADAPEAFITAKRDGSSTDNSGGEEESTTEADDRSTQQKTHGPEETVNSESVEPSKDSSAMDDPEASTTTKRDKSSTDNSGDAEDAEQCIDIVESNSIASSKVAQTPHAPTEALGAGADSSTDMIVEQQGADRPRDIVKTDSVELSEDVPEEALCTTPGKETSEGISIDHKNTVPSNATIESEYVQPNAFDWPRETAPTTSASGLRSECVSDERIDLPETDYAATDSISATSGSDLRPLEGGPATPEKSPSPSHGSPLRLRAEHHVSNHRAIQRQRSRERSSADVNELSKGIASDNEKVRLPQLQKADTGPSVNNIASGLRSEGQGKKTPEREPSPSLRSSPLRQKAEHYVFNHRSSQRRRSRDSPTTDASELSAKNSPYSQAICSPKLGTAEIDSVVVDSSAKQQGRQTPERHPSPSLHSSPLRLKAEHLVFSHRASQRRRSRDSAAADENEPPTANPSHNDRFNSSSTDNVACDSVLDTSASEQRLLQHCRETPEKNPPPSVSGSSLTKNEGDDVFNLRAIKHRLAREKRASVVSATKRADQTPNVGELDGEHSGKVGEFSTPPRSESPARPHSHERKSLAEMARQRRIAKTKHDDSPLRQPAAKDITPSRSIARMARLKREAKRVSSESPHKQIAKEEDFVPKEAQPVSQRIQKASGEKTRKDSADVQKRNIVSSFAKLARRKREEKKAM